MDAIEEQVLAEMMAEFVAQGELTLDEASTERAQEMLKGTFTYQGRVLNLRLRAWGLAVLNTLPGFENRRMN